MTDAEKVAQAITGKPSDKLRPAFVGSGAGLRDVKEFARWLLDVDALVQSAADAIGAGKVQATTGADALGDSPYDVTLGLKGAVDDGDAQ